MNIFYLSEDPAACARAHCDKHAVKMVLETAQLLSTAHHLMGCGDGLYKPTHQNHPCAIWVRQSVDNYAWAYELFAELCKEFRFRRGKVHACERLLGALVHPPAGLVGFSGATPPAQAMPPALQRPSAVEAYQLYYLTEKRSIAAWNWGREAPSWWQ